MVQRAEHPDPGVQKWTSIFGSQDDRLYRGLPLRSMLSRLRECHDVVGRIAEGPQRPPFGDDRIIELARPRHQREPSVPIRGGGGWGLTIAPR